MKKLFFTLILLTSCAQFKKNWIASNCNPDGAYSMGVQDAQNSKEHDNADFVHCGEGFNIGSLQKSYSQGFSSVKGNSLHILRTTLERADDYYECSYNVFNDNFSAGGNSVSEAKYKILQKCKRSEHSFYCSNIDIQCNKM